jgi:2-polyprenyl-3-methyl-5-hydroxy-6-metoxy-1,4-benzoquinol methylase
MDISGYQYCSSADGCAHTYLLPAVMDALHRGASPGKSKRLFDLGCGNGAVAHHLTAQGFNVVGVDPSREGSQHANQSFPQLTLRLGSTEEDLASVYGQFEFLISLEVVEHVYDPRQFARRVYDLLLPGGLAIISTPYHSYLKNLALAVTGQMDRHFTALWPHGHIKFWSRRTLGLLMTEAGFQSVAFKRVGRCTVLAKSMMALAWKPSAAVSSTALRQSVEGV